MIAGWPRPAYVPRSVSGMPGWVCSHALDVGLVDHRLVVGRARRAVGRPFEVRRDHHAGHRVAQRIDLRWCAARGQVVGLQVIGEQRLAEVEVAVKRLAVGIEQQLARIAAVPRGRIPRAVDAETVALVRLDGREVAVPDVAVDLVEVDPLLAAVLGDQAQLYPFGHLGEQREVGACTVVAGAKGISGARPDGGYRRLIRRHQSAHQPVAAAI